jgi:uncharacterized protein Yka (UPF0111/DUF47 family)
MDAKEKIQKKIESLRSNAKSCLDQRVSLGRGYKGMTDQLLQDANNYESQADDLQKILNELDED